jgi:hypothetical protein
VIFFNPMYLEEEEMEEEKMAGDKRYLMKSWL